jgi:pimeloyl-ACP methyl ester carboxylesterase
MWLFEPNCLFYFSCSHFVLQFQLLWCTLDSVCASHTPFMGVVLLSSFWHILSGVVARSLTVLFLISARRSRFDARGMGSSPCPPGPYTWSELCNDTVSLINEVFGQQSKVALLGVSMGGMLAQHLASAEYLGSRLSHVVLVSTTGSTAGQEAVWKQRRALLQDEVKKPQRKKNVVC